MGRRKCCCPCDIDGSCDIKRDNARSADLILEIPDGFTDLAYCSETPRTCEEVLPGDYIAVTTGTLSWAGLESLANCHCVESDFIELTCSIIQECVDISEEGDPEELVCHVTVVIDLFETSGCPDPSAGASHRWTYKAVGPIDIEGSGAEFEVPFFDELTPISGGNPDEVCVIGDYPPSVFIKE